MTDPRTLPVLVVDDDSTTLKLIDVVLRLSGFQVRMAKSASGGLALAGAEPYCAVLLDRRLPDGDGIDMCVTMRTEMKMTVPIIIITAERDPDLRALALDAGAVDVLFKPFLPRDLVAKVEDVTLS